MRLGSNTVNMFAVNLNILSTRKGQNRNTIHNFCCLEQVEIAPKHKPIDRLKMKKREKNTKFWQISGSAFRYPLALSAICDSYSLLSLFILFKFSIHDSNP